MGFSRRKFLALGIGSGIAAIYGTYKWFRGDPTDVVVAILKRRVGYLRVEQNSFHTFAKDYLRHKKEYEGDLRKLSVVSLPLQFFSPYRWLRPGHALRRLEDNVVSLYLLSTDFFQNGSNEGRPVAYLSFYDPYSTVCRNPFHQRP